MPQPSSPVSITDSITLPVSLVDGYITIPQPLSITIPLQTPSFTQTITVKINGNVAPNIISFSLSDAFITWSALVDPTLANQALFAKPNSNVEFIHGTNHFQAACTLETLTFQGTPQGDMATVSFKITGVNGWTTQ